MKSKSRLEHFDIADYETLSEAEIERLSSVFSFDISEFEKRLDRGDDWQRILVGHLFFDHVLTALIEEALVQPTQMDLERTTFAAKIGIAGAMALLPEDSLPFLKRINKVRNRIAHDLTYRVVRGDIKELENASTALVRDEMAFMRSKHGGTRLFWLISLNLIFAELYRQKRVAGRIKSKKISAEVSRVAKSIREAQRKG